jgi:hypothetical protein
MFEHHRRLSERSRAVHRAPRVPQVPRGPRAAARRLALVARVTAVLGASVQHAAAQTRVTPGSHREEAGDSSDLHGGARRAQRDFERKRFHYLPVALGSYGSECDERVGRFCITWDESPDWTPEPEDPKIGLLRRALLARLDSIQRHIPGDGWVLGQRVWYRGESGDWAGSLDVARRCGTARSWWCAALGGLALHGLGRYVEAQAAFERALDAMPPEEARKWRVPRWVVGSHAKSLLEHAAAPRLDTLLTRLWLLADPLYLVPGNDRLTGHYARWTVASLRKDTRNLYNVAWDADMAELLIRNGWEVAWSRSHDPFDLTARDAAIGHNDPEARDFMPPASALEDPSSATPEDLTADVSVRRSLYQPSYAPVLLPMDGQLAVFPRADSLVVVATAYVPDDTTKGAREGRDRPWMAPGAYAASPDQEGLFLVPENGGSGWHSSRIGSGPVGLVVEAPAGRYVASAEAWSPSRRLAGRRRQGVRWDGVPRDVATLSDLLLVDPSRPEPTSLEDAARVALLRPEIAPGETVRVVWEVGGLGWRPETVAYSVSVERADEGVLHRFGRLLHLTSRARPLALQWTEPGPSRPAMALRSVVLNLPELDPGAYRLRLETRLPGRSPLISEVVFGVVR